MNWSLIVTAGVAIVGFSSSLIAAWIALSMRTQAAESKTQVAELRIYVEKMRTDYAEQRVGYAERRADEFKQLRSDINGSYMRANLVLQIVEGIRGELRATVEGIHTEIRAIAARITLMEEK